VEAGTKGVLARGSLQTYLVDPFKSAMTMVPDIPLSEKSLAKSRSSQKAGTAMIRVRKTGNRRAIDLNTMFPLADEAMGDVNESCVMALRPHRLSSARGHLSGMAFSPFLPDLRDACTAIGPEHKAEYS